LPNVFWLPSFASGSIGIALRPRGGDWLCDEVAHLRAEGVDLLVSLLTTEEQVALGLLVEAECCITVGIEYVSAPMRDLGAPNDAADFRKLIRRLAANVRAGKSVAIHCRQSPLALAYARRGCSPRALDAAEEPLTSRSRMTACLYVLALGVGACTPERGGPMHDVQHISVSIARRPAEVYEFASDPRNLPRWAAGLARSEVRRDGDEWVADAPFGKIRVRFVQRNSFGVMDHDVKLESGVSIHNPMRVVPNGEGSEFVFTLIRQPGMSDGQFAKDKAAVENDLKTLKDLLERKSSS